MRESFNWLEALVQKVDADLWHPLHFHHLFPLCYALGQQLLSLKLNFLYCFCTVEKAVVDLSACRCGRFSLLSQWCHVSCKIWPLRCFDICHRKILISDLFKETLFLHWHYPKPCGWLPSWNCSLQRVFFLLFSPPFPLNQNFLPHKRMVGIVLFLSGSKSPVSEAMASVSSELAAAKQLPPGAKSYYLWMLLLLPLIVQSHEAPIKEGGGERWLNHSPNYHAFYELMPGGRSITFQLSWLPVVWCNDVQNLNSVWHNLRCNRSKFHFFLLWKSEKKGKLG